MLIEWVRCSSITRAYGAPTCTYPNREVFVSPTAAKAPQKSPPQITPSVGGRSTNLRSGLRAAEMFLTSAISNSSSGTGASLRNTGFAHPASDGRLLSSGMDMPTTQAQQEIKQYPVPPRSIEGVRYHQSPCKKWKNRLRPRLSKLLACVRDILARTSNSPNPNSDQNPNQHTGSRT